MTQFCMIACAPATSHYETRAKATGEHSGVLHKLHGHFFQYFIVVCATLENVQLSISYLC